MGTRISVIVPAYNAEQFIGQTLRSVLDQTRPADEIIVVDDGSTDRTPEVARLVDADIRIIEQANAGVCAARNWGVAQSSGDLLAFLDADDLWAPRKLETQLGIFDRFPQLGVVATNFDEIDVEGRPMARPMKQPVHMYGKATNMHHELLHHGNVLCVSSTVMRRTAFDAVGGFYAERRILSADYDMWIRMSEAHDFYVVPEVLCHYRILEQSAIHGSLSKEYGAQRGILERHRHRFSEAAFRARMTRLHVDWADSALFENDPAAWQLWRGALAQDWMQPRLWWIGARTAVRNLLAPNRNARG